MLGRYSVERADDKCIKRRGRKKVEKRGRRGGKIEKKKKNRLRIVAPG